MVTKKRTKSRKPCKKSLQLLKVITKTCAKRSVNKFGSLQKSLTKLLQRANKSKKSRGKKSKSKSKSAGRKLKNCSKGYRRVGRICRSTVDLAFLKAQKAQGKSDKEAREMLREIKKKALAAALGASPAVKKVAAAKVAAKKVAAKKGKTPDPYKGLDADASKALFIKRQGQTAWDNFRQWHAKNNPTVAAPAAKKSAAAKRSGSNALKSPEAILGRKRYDDFMSAKKAAGMSHKDAQAAWNAQKKRVDFTSSTAGAPATPAPRASRAPRAVTPAATAAPVTWAGRLRSNVGKIKEGIAEAFKGKRTLFE
jgi:hypothetical protein